MAIAARAAAAAKWLDRTSLSVSRREVFQDEPGRRNDTPIDGHVAERIPADLRVDAKVPFVINLNVDLTRFRGHGV